MEVEQVIEQPITLKRDFKLVRSTEQVIWADPLADLWVSVVDDYKPLDYLLMRDGVGCVPRNALQGLAGRMKNGKTTAGLCMIVALLQGSFMGFTATKDDYKCLIVDTEMSRRNGTCGLKKRQVYELAGLPIDTDSPRLRYLSLLEKSVGERMELLEEAIKQVKPDFVLLDGVVDLCKDFMESSSSRELAEGLERLAEREGCAIMCVIHTNKKDEELRGHLGTEIQNKCTEYYIVRKTDGVAKVEQAGYRYGQISDFAFSFDDDGKPMPADARSKAAIKQDGKRQELEDAFKMIFKERGEYSYKELVETCERIFKVAERTAKDRIKKATELGIISKGDNSGTYCLGDFSPDIIPVQPVENDSILD